MYTTRNYRKSTDVREAVARYLLGHGPAVSYYQPGPFGGNEPGNGDFVLEGPHYPQAHSWYLKGVARDGVLVWVNGLPAALNPDAKTYNKEKGLAALALKYPQFAPTV